MESIDFNQLSSEWLVGIIVFSTSEKRMTSTTIQLAAAPRKPSRISLGCPACPGGNVRPLWDHEAHEASGRACEADGLDRGSPAAGANRRGSRPRCRTWPCAAGTHPDRAASHGVGRDR